LPIAQMRSSVDHVGTIFTLKRFRLPKRAMDVGLNWTRLQLFFIAKCSTEMVLSSVASAFSPWSMMFLLPVPASTAKEQEACVSHQQVNGKQLTKLDSERQKEAPMVQRLFSSSPRDPRYHMLSYISSKFSEAPTSASHEPRAALFLNRFSRTSTIMYATDGVSSILGVRSDQLVNKSFYFCIAEDCLQDAVRCLESAKSNDSIAYLRFWFRNPLLEERNRAASRDETQSSGEDEDDGGVRLLHMTRHLWARLAPDLTPMKPKHPPHWLLMK